MTGAYFARVVVYEGVAADDQSTGVASFLVKLAGLVPDALIPPTAFESSTKVNADGTRTIRVVLDVWLPRNHARSEDQVRGDLRYRLRDHLPTFILLVMHRTIPPPPS